MKKIIITLLSLVICFLQGTQVLALTELEDDYVVYHINESNINEFGNIVMDGERITNALLEKMWSKKPGQGWVPGETSVGKLKIINDLPYDIEFKDYTIKVPSYEDVTPLLPSETLRTSLPQSGSTGTGAKGKDGHIIPIGLNCFRCPNLAIQALYDKRATAITLEDLMHLENKLEEVYGEKMSYATYLCRYYHVNSLDELTPQQKSQILDGGNFYVTRIGNKEVLKEKETLTYACSENNGSLYIVHEFDKDVIELGYNYYFDSLMTFSFDKSLQVLNDKTSFDYAIINYLDASSPVRKQLDTFLKGKTIRKEEAITFDSLQFHISGPLMGNAYANRDVPAFMNFEFQFTPLTIQGYAFIDVNENGYLDDDDQRLKETKMNLWKNDNLIETTTTDENGYYHFDNKREGDTYTLSCDVKDGYTLTKSSQHELGNRFIKNDEDKAELRDFKVNDQVTYCNIGFVEKTYHVYYDANGGQGEVIDEKNPYHPLDKVNLLDASSISRENYTFIGWNSQSDGQGISYKANQVIEMPTHDVVLYAMWIKNITVSKDEDKESKEEQPIINQPVDTSDVTAVEMIVTLFFVSGVFILVMNKLKNKS